MDVVFRRQPVTVQEVRAELPDPPTANAVRTMLGNLVGKGYLSRGRNGRAALYTTRQRRETAARAAMRRLLQIFFGGSLERAVATHLADPRASLSVREIEAIRSLLEKSTGDSQGVKHESA